jgi:hypothetical protein
MFKSLAVTVTAVLLLSACSTAPTTANRPDKFDHVQTGRYDVTKQLEFMDCVMDGFMGAQRVEGALQVRQICRADGYRLDLISGPLQYLVASFRTDGSYELCRSSYAVMVQLTKEQDAAAVCLDRFKAT